MNFSPKGKDRQPIDKEDRRDKRERTTREVARFFTRQYVFECWCILRMVRIVYDLSQHCWVQGNDVIDVLYAIFV